MNAFENLSAAQLHRAATLKQEIENLTAQLNKFLGGNVPAVARVKPAKVHWTQTPAGRAKMARLQRANWRKRKAKV